MAKSRAVKQELRQELEKRFEDSSASILAEYRGLKCEEINALRKELRKVGCDFKVLKNRVAQKAIDVKGEEYTALRSSLKGPIGIAYVKSDVAAGAKALLAFAKDHENLKIKGGLLDGQLLSDKDIKALSELPSKEVLLGRIVGTLVAPHRGLLTVLNGVGTKVVRVIGAIKDKKAE